MRYKKHQTLRQTINPASKIILYSNKTIIELYSIIAYNNSHYTSYSAALPSSSFASPFLLTLCSMESHSESITPSQKPQGKFDFWVTSNSHDQFENWDAELGWCFIFGLIVFFFVVKL